jgi:hypothetical protein
MHIFVRVEGVRESRQLLDLDGCSTWRAFMLLVAELLCMEDIEGVYTMDGLQMWRLETLMQAGEGREYTVKFSESAALLRSLAAEGPPPPETAHTSWERVQEATAARYRTRCQFSRSV